MIAQTCHAEQFRVGYIGPVRSRAVAECEEAMVRVSEAVKAGNDRDDPREHQLTHEGLYLIIDRSSGLGS
jgi:hypothetical protein